MRSDASLWILALALGAACSSNPAAPGTGPSRGADASSDTAADASDSEVPDPDGVGVPTDAAADADAPTDDAEPDSALCREGERECSGPGFRRTCVLGRWQVSPCGAGQVCEAGNCVDGSAGPCVEGDHQCVDGAPAICASGEWVGTGACTDGLVCSGGACVSAACASAASSGSYLGCEYLASPLPNLAWGFSGTPDSPLGIVLANASAERPVRVWVYEADGATLAPLVGEVTVALGIAGGGVSPATVRSEVFDRRRTLVDAGMTQADGVEIPPAGTGIFLVRHKGNPTGTSVRADTYWVRTDAPVAAYQFGPYCCNYSFTNDASLLLPTSSFGRDYLFLGTPSWGSMDDSSTGSPGSRISNTISVVGHRRGTEVSIELPPDAAVVPPTGGRVTATADTVTATIGPGEVLHVYGAPPATDRLPIRGTDLSGARIRSTAPVGVFSGHECTYYPWDRAACDHLEEQLLPIDTWGRQFELAPPRFRSANLAVTSETLYWKVIASQDGTEIALGASWSSLETSPPGFAGVPFCGDFVEGGTTIRLDEGQHCEFGSRRAFSLDASAPIMVMGVISGSDSVGFGARTAGDPGLFAVPPRRQYRNEYAFVAPTTYALDYVTVLAPTDAVLVLDGAPVDMSRAASIAGTSSVYLAIPIDDGAHRIVGDQPFGILVYAYDDWVSYAFTGGLNLVKE